MRWKKSLKFHLYKIPKKSR